MKFVTTDGLDLYVRTMGKLLRVTRAFETEKEANAYMETHRDEGVVAEIKDGPILLANLYDKGITVTK